MGSQVLKLMSEFTQNIILKKMRNARISLTECEQENQFSTKTKTEIRQGNDNNFEIKT